MRVAVLTSGGDCQAMNLTLASILRNAGKNVEIYKVVGGFDGLIDNKIYPFTLDEMLSVESLGGSFIKSARSARFLQDKYVVKSSKNLLKLDIHKLIVIGGNGSFNGGRDLSKYGIDAICLPATIDNDLNMDKTLGFDSALNEITRAIDNILDCTFTFNTGAIVQIMGRNCVDLTVATGEIYQTKYLITKAEDVETIAKRITKEKPKKLLVLLKENTINIDECVKILENQTKRVFKPHILGYIQRGGKPSAFDRWYACVLGEKAVGALKLNKSVAIGYNAGSVQILDLDSVLNEI